MRDLFLDTLVSEKFAIKVLRDRYHIPSGDIEHITAEDADNPIDLRYRGLTFDVKFSNPQLTSQDKTQKAWDFDIRGKHDYCDYFLLVGMINYRPKSVFLVSAAGAPRHHIRVSIQGHSKWHEYKIWG